MVFTIQIKKDDGGSPDIDFSKIHSTVEIHVMNSDSKPTNCHLCKKKLKDGDNCQIYITMSHQSKITHVTCAEEKQR